MSECRVLMHGPSRLAVVARRTENAAEGASALEPDRIVTRDQAAARRWLVRVIAARAVELHRERGKRSNPGEDGDDGHDNAAFSEERSERAG